MSFSAALTKFSHHMDLIRALQERYRKVYTLLPLEIFQLTPTSARIYQDLYEELLEGITWFPRQEFWQYPYVFSPNVLKDETDWYRYENIFLWEKEEVLKILQLENYDPFRDFIFTRPYHREIMELMHGCFMLSAKRLVRHVPEVYVILYEDGSVYFCDKEKNHMEFPEITLSSELREQYHIVTVEFLHNKQIFYGGLQGPYPRIFPIHVYDVVNSDQEV